MKVLVSNDIFYAQALPEGCMPTEDVGGFLNGRLDVDLILFTGGEDVSPELYGHTSPKHFCSCNRRRDEIETMIFNKALHNNIPMTGICRGSQILNVLSGGIMMHHINNHGISGVHSVVTSTGETFSVTSTHHQMCIPGDGGYVIAESEDRRSNIYVGDEDRKVDYTGPEVEAIYYPKTKVAAVQWHPEYMPEEAKAVVWYKQLVNDLVNLSEQEFTSKYVKAYVAGA